jgi:ribose 5-phosphate isomerase A
MTTTDEKKAVGTTAALMVRNGMRVGLGSGTTVAYLIDALGSRHVDASYVASSPATATAARAAGLRLEEADEWAHLDLAIDGADQVGEDGWIAKGAGGALTREKVICAAASRYVVIIDSTKLVSTIGSPIALELLDFGLAATLARLQGVSLRLSERTPNGGVLADFRGEIPNVEEFADRLAATPGVIEHGLFAPAMIDEVLVARDSTVESLTRPL